MEFVGEHLWIGKIGHFFVLLSFVASLLATIGYVFATTKKDIQEQQTWLKYSRFVFFIQCFAVLTVFAFIFELCSKHYYEYFFAYKHTSNELEFKYLLACIWEDQSGSFLLWSIWHCVLGIFVILQSRKPEQQTWEAPVMSMVSLAQVFLAMMIMGVNIGAIKIGNSPFVLTRNEMNAPIFAMPDYLSKIQDGIGLNVLLRNYWMVIHPPILFLGFASTLIPFGYAIGGLIRKNYGDWIKPALPYVIFSCCALGVGIMMGGKWAYESLSFGGYWAWDPVENASLVPWLVLVGGLHTMLVYKATGHSLKASYLLVILTFLFILYSTFLTRTGILGDTSVHAFTEAGKAMNILILSFLLFFTIGSLLLFILNLKNIPAIKTEEEINTREFWMFISALVFLISGLYISAKTSLPVINSVFGTKLAPPENVEFSYNKVMILVSIIIGILSAVGQYMRYKKTPKGELLKKIIWPTLITALIMVIISLTYPITYYKEGGGFLIAIYVALVAAVYAVCANLGFIWVVLKGKLKFAGGSFSHIGFSLMIAGMLISAGNKKVISEEKMKTIDIPMSIDPLTKEKDNAAENINLIKRVPNRMGDYRVTYLYDSAGEEKGRRFYQVLFEKNLANTKEVTETFTLKPDVYVMKDNNMSSNPDIKSYLTHDIFTYVSYAMNPEKNVDTAHYKISEVKEGDTIFYSKGYMTLQKIEKQPTTNKFGLQLTGPAVKAVLQVRTMDSMTYDASPMLTIDSAGIHQYDDTVFSQNLYVQFSGVSDDQQRIKIGVKESDKMMDFVTLKAYLFPYINLVWLGLVIMVVGFTLSLVHRLNLSKVVSAIILIVATVSMWYMFFLANT
ncbi:MAG: hypothetical protein RLY16_2408 [Bacteroidota bacterium]|jgi:cytochrome c-type biogenesis protein CcmF